MTAQADQLRVVFALTTFARSDRWHSVLRELTKIFPRLTVLTGGWYGFAQGYENAFSVTPLRGVRHVTVRRTASGHRSGFQLVSPIVLTHLYRLRPDVTISVGFGLWTAYAILLKKIRGSCVVVLWQGSSPETGGTKGSIRLFARRRFAKSIDSVLTNTTCGARYLQDEVGIPSGNILTAVYEVADRTAMSTAIGPSLAVPRRPCFLFVGRLIVGKGVAVLLDAIAILRARIQSTFSVVIAGTGEHDEKLREQARTAGVMDVVDWVGQVPFGALGSLYKACDVFILPSLEDTWGVVVMEAMAFGKPVVCSRAAGVSQVVQEGLNGILISPDNPGELANAMEKFVLDPSLAIRLGRNALRTAEMHSPASAATALASSVFRAFH